MLASGEFWDTWENLLLEHGWDEVDKLPIFVSLKIAKERLADVKGRLADVKGRLADAKGRLADAQETERILRDAVNATNGD